MHRLILGVLVACAAVGAGCGSDEGTATTVEVSVAEVPTDDISGCLVLWNRTATDDERALMATAQGDVFVEASLVYWNPEPSAECRILLVTPDRIGVELSQDEAFAEHHGWLRVSPATVVDEGVTVMPPGNARAQGDGTLVASGHPAGDGWYTINAG
jgi:hypothetical protein